MDLLLAGILSSVSGVVIGTLGAGGSILMIPILVYVLQMPVKTAMGITLLTIGLTGFLAAISHQRQKNVFWQIAVPWSIAGMIASYFGGRLAQFLPETVLLLIFGLVVIAAAISLLRGVKGKSAVTDADDLIIDLSMLRILPTGAGLGFLTGLIGGGGGFLLVPALHQLKIRMHQAIGTSLAIISIQSVAGFVGYSNHTQFSISVLSVVSGATIFGSLFGAELNRHLSSTQLKAAFAFLLLGVGIITLIGSLTSGKFF